VPDTVDKTLGGADRRITVSVLDPDDWFAPVGRPPTEGNLVTALVDGRRTMAEMARAFLGSTFVYLTGWEVDDGVSMLRARGFTGQRLVDVLGRAAGGRARVRVLLSADASSTETAGKLRGAGAQVVLDDKGQATGTSHRQRSAVADGGGQGAVGFCGGIDLASGRWDFPEHPAFDSRRDRDPDLRTSSATANPWHDVHAMVRGPAVGALEANFADRWNEHGAGETITPRSHDPVATGTHVVQVVRTVGKGSYAFARDGELGVRAAYLTALGQAARYVYIENERFMSEELTVALIEAMERNAAAGRVFRIILVLPKDPSESERQDLLVRLRAADPGGVLGVYFLHQPFGGRDIFVFAKVAIVDDVWATIGSANLEGRGLLSDTEMNLVVVDAELADGGRRFARDLRLELWREHLRLDPDALGTIADPIAGAGVWAAQAGSAGSRVRALARG
jgi:phosphatidylserine/phosphatidylglycerophosphate/cardiolipin synthase-like enzyme